MAIDEQGIHIIHRTGLGIDEQFVLAVRAGL